LRLTRKDFDALRAAAKQEAKALAVVHHRYQWRGGCGGHDYLEKSAPPCDDAPKFV
jgi:hypothetical protein